MELVSPAIAGADYSAAQSFSLAVTTGAPGAATAIASGGYTVTAQGCDCDIKLGSSSSDVATVMSNQSQAGATQPAVNRTVRVLAGTTIAFDIPLGKPPSQTSWFVSAITGTGSGNAIFCGVLKGGQNTEIA